MSFYVYRPLQRVFLADDEQIWTDSIFEAAAFSTRALADEAAERAIGPGHDGYVLDDGIAG